MIGYRKRQSVLNAVKEKKTTALTYVEASVLTSFTKLLDPNELYLRLFGRREPVGFTSTMSPELREIDALWKETKRPFAPTLEMPTCPKEQWLRLPVTKGLYLEIPDLKNCTSIVEATRASYYYADPSPKRVMLTRINGEIPEGYLVKCRTLIVDTVGPEAMEGLERLLNLRTHLAHSSSLFESYIGLCRSLGGLFKKLPVLNTLAPDLRVEHVRLTRQTPDPPPELVEKLNLIATLWGASQSAKGAKKEG